MYGNRNIRAGLCDYIGSKEIPDFTKIKELEEEGDGLYDERNRIYFVDKELIKYVRDNYDPIIRKRHHFNKGESAGNGRIL